MVAIAKGSDEARKKLIQMVDEHFEEERGDLANEAAPFYDEISPEIFKTCVSEIQNKNREAI